MVEIEDVKLVDITEEGVFKYILIQIRNEKDEKKTIVRGYSDCTWHADIFDRVEAKLAPLRCKCLGGGRLDHNPKRKSIEVYGISEAFGKADHQKAALLLKSKYSDYTISVNEDT